MTVVLCRRCSINATSNEDAVCDPCRARAAMARLQDRMDEIVEPEPQFDTMAEHRGER